MLNQTKKQAQDLSKKIAKQIAREPLEVLKSAAGQLNGEQMAYYEGKFKEEAKEEKKDNKTEELKNKDKAQASRTLQALEREIKDIRLDKLIKELQRKIANGEEISLESFSELSPEQKQVLQAQMEAVKQKQVTRDKEQAPLVEPKSKRARGSWLFGGKMAAERQKTHVEKPLPPSG